MAQSDKSLTSFFLDQFAKSGSAMFRIEKRPSGFLLTFGGFIEKKEMEDWLAESCKHLSGVSKGFGVVVDMRTLAPLHSDAKSVMLRGQELYKNAGMERSAVILSNVITTFQFRNLAMQSGIHAYERYLDASTDPKWEEKALNWVKFGLDPVCEASEVEAHAFNI